MKESGQNMVQVGADCTIEIDNVSITWAAWTSWVGVGIGVSIGTSDTMGAVDSQRTKHTLRK